MMCLMVLKYFEGIQREENNFDVMNVGCIDNVCLFKTYTLQQNIYNTHSSVILALIDFLQDF